MKAERGTIDRLLEARSGRWTWVRGVWKGTVRQVWGRSHPGGRPSPETWRGVARRGSFQGRGTEDLGSRPGYGALHRAESPAWGPALAIGQLAGLESPGGEGAGRKATRDGEQGREGSLTLTHVEFEVPLGPHGQLTSRA